MVVFAPVWHKDPAMAVPQTIPVRTAKTKVINAVKIPVFLSPMNLEKKCTLHDEDINCIFKKVNPLFTSKYRVATLMKTSSTLP